MPRKSDTKRLSSWLKEERERVGATQLDIAKVLKRRQSVVSNLETGRRRLDVLEFIELADALGTSPEQLLTRLLAQLGRSPK